MPPFGAWRYYVPDVTSGSHRSQRGRAVVRPFPSGGMGRRLAARAGNPATTPGDTSGVRGSHPQATVARVLGSDSSKKVMRRTSLITRANGRRRTLTLVFHAIDSGDALDGPADRTRGL